MKVRQFFDKANYLYSVKMRRLIIARIIFSDRTKYGQLKPLSAEQLKAIDDVWGQRKKYFDMRWFEFYNYLHPELGNDISYCIPIDYWLTYIDTKLNDPVASAIYDDKNMYDLLLPNVPQPKTIVRFIDGDCLDKEYRVIDWQKALEYCKSEEAVIVKPAVNSCGGHGIFIWCGKKDSPSLIKDALDSKGCFVVQSLVRQHPALSLNNSPSCSTIRMLSMMYDGKAVVFPRSFVRIGGEDSAVANVCSGGYYVGVAADGKIDNQGRNQFEEVIKLDIGERYIPNYDKCIKIAEENTARFAHATKLVAWDFTIDENGEPVMIECNFERTALQSFQILYGPYMKEYLPYFFSLVSEHQDDGGVIYSLLNKRVERKCRNIR